MTAKESVSESLIGSATRVLLQIASAFEPLAPAAITVLMNQQMHRYNVAGAIENYKTRTKRLVKSSITVRGRFGFDWYAGNSSFR